MTRRAVLSTSCTEKYTCTELYTCTVCATFKKRSVPCRNDTCSAPAARYHLKRKNYFSMIAVFANMTAQLCCVPPDRSAAQTALNLGHSSVEFINRRNQEARFKFAKSYKCFRGS